MNDAGTVTFRDATTADAARLASLLSDEGYPAGATDLEGRLERFAHPDRVIVAEAGGEVVGFIAFAFIPRFENNGQFMRIIAIVVDPGVRERGIGRMLFAEAERIAVDEGAAFFEITAGHHRPEARHLYGSLGYEPGVTTYLRKRP